MNKSRKIRVLWGFFPVWLQLIDDKGNELNQVTGFWADIAHYVDLSFAFIAHHITFSLWDREEFMFFPYEANGCKNWFQAIYKACQIAQK